jgi:hypothetical protein
VPGESFFPTFLYSAEIADHIQRSDLFARVCSPSKRAAMDTWPKGIYWILKRCLRADEDNIDPLERAITIQNRLILYTIHQYSMCFLLVNIRERERVYFFSARETKKYTFSFLLAIILVFKVTQGDRHERESDGS